MSTGNPYSVMPHAQVGNSAPGVTMNGTPSTMPLGGGASGPMPYAQGISIPGTAANNGATTYQTMWDPTTQTWGSKLGTDGALAPIFSADQWNQVMNNSKGTNETWSNWNPNPPKTTGTPTAFPSTTAGGLKNNLNGNTFNGRGNGGGMGNTPTLTIHNKGGGSTQVGYQLDPKTGYYVPNSARGIGQDSWWQSQGFTDLALAGAAAFAGPALASALGGGALGGAGAGAIIGGGSAAATGGNVLKGAALGGIGGGLASEVSGLAGGGWQGGAAGGATAGAATSALTGRDPITGAITGGVGGGVGSGVGGDWGSFAGKVASTATGALLNSGNSGNNGGSMPGTTASGQPIDPNNPVNWGTNVGNGNILQGLSQLWNTYQGNQANQNIGNNLMNMYNTAGTQAAPSVAATNNMITDPSSYFNSPLYKAQANLYGDQVMAGKNAAGTNGNNIDYTQKMMGFAGQQYNNTLANYNNAAQGFLGNQAKYGQDYAFGTALNNTSNSASKGNYANGLAQLFSGAGGNSLLSSLGGMGSSFLKGLFGGGDTSQVNPADYGYILNQSPDMGTMTQDFAQMGDPTSNIQNFPGT